MSRTFDSEQNGCHRVRSGHPTRYRKRIAVVTDRRPRWHPPAMGVCQPTGQSAGPKQGPDIIRQGAEDQAGVPALGLPHGLHDHPPARVADVDQVYHSANCVGSWYLPCGAQHSRANRRRGSFRIPPEIVAGCAVPLVGFGTNLRNPRTWGIATVGASALSTIPLL